MHQKRECVNWHYFSKTKDLKTYEIKHFPRLGLQLQPLKGIVYRYKASHKYGDGKLVLFSLKEGFIFGDSDRSNLNQDRQALLLNNYSKTDDSKQT